MSPIVRCLIPLVCFAWIFLGCGDGPDTENAQTSEPEDPAYWVQRAQEEQELGALAEAVDILNRVLQKHPDHVAAHHRLGAVYEEWDKRKEAVAAYEKTLKLDADHLDARLGLASVYGKMNRNVAAAKEYIKAAQNRPGDAALHFKIALEYWYAQKLTESAEYYRKVIAIDPGHIQAHLNLISVYERMEDWDKALEEVEIALKLGEETNDAHAISIANRKRPRLEERRHFTAQDMERKTKPPFN